MTSAVDFPGRKSALVLMALFLGGFLVQIFLIRADRRIALEEIQFPTAAGDIEYFPEPENFTVGDPVAHFEDRKLEVAAAKIKTMPGFRLDRVGKDATGRFSIYRLREGKDGFLYLKTGPKSFLPVRERTTTAP